MSLKKHNIYGIIAAVIYTITVIILLFLLGFTTPLPLPPEEAILIDFGGGNINAGASSSTNTSNAQNTSSQISSHDGVNTQANEEAPFMQSGTNPAENPNGINTYYNSLFQNIVILPLNKEYHFFSIFLF
jgi:hypothetical protein